MEKTMEKENMMGTMPEGRLLFKLALPMIFSVLVSSLYNIVDSIFVGSATLLALTGSVRLVWWAFPISEIVIFALSSVFLFRIYRLALPEDKPLSHTLTESALAGNM